MYQMPGSEYSRCISLESSGLPEAVRLPAMAQALEPGKRLVAGARWRNRKLTLRASPSASMPRFDQIVAPRGGESAEHVEADQQGIDHAPRAGLVAEQGELQRQVVAGGWR